MFQVLALLKVGNGAETEWKLKSDHRDGILTDKLCVISFIFEFCCVLFFKSSVYTVRHLIQLRRLTGWQRWLYNCVTVFCVSVQLCWTAYIFRHNRKAVLNNDSFVMLVRWVSHLHETSRLWQQSLEIPHSSLTVLRAVAYVGSCGSMWNLNWAPQVNWTVADEAGIYWGKKYISCWNNRFLKSSDIYIYMIQNNLLLSHQRNICISLISKVRNARCML
jgi:hypothetical protein